MTLSINFGKVTVLAAFAVALACLSPISFAHAADLGFGDSTGDYIDWSTPADYASSYGDSTGDYVDWSTPADYNYGDSTGSYVDWTTPASYDYGGGYGSGSYFGGSGFVGGGFVGGGGFGGGGSTYAPTTVSTYAPTNTNTCTAPNSCNSTVDDHSIFNAPTTVTVSGGGGGSYPVYQPVYQPIYTPAPVYTPACSTCSCYGNCAPTPIYPSVARAPYVSLSAVPYTGLDLGPVGTVLYWGFLVLWCLAAAYLVAVKRIQTTLVSKLNAFLFGSTSLTASGALRLTPVAHSHSAPKAHKAAVKEDATDPFIASQIAR